MVHGRDFRINIWGCRWQCHFTPVVQTLNMAFTKICLAVCSAVMLLTQGESRQLCGQEIEYRGFNPIDALQMIQARQFQEFEQFKNTLSQLKFKLQTDDYYAWKKCLSEYEKEKLRYLQSVEKCKSSFNGLVQSLAARKLDAAQYEQELQKIFQQFQTQFTPAVNLFKTNIKYLYDTIRDEKRRRTWWSTVKTTEEVTTSADGKTTRTAITQVDSGIGNKRTQSVTKKAQTVSPGGGYDGPSGGQSVSGYGASQQQSGYDAVSRTKNVKEESAYIGKVTGSTADNSDINFSNTQTRSGLKEGYSTSGSYKASSGGYKSSEGAYRRKRRTYDSYGSKAGSVSYGDNGGGSSSKSSKVTGSGGYSSNGGGSGGYGDNGGKGGYGSGGSGVSSFKKGGSGDYADNGGKGGGSGDYSSNGGKGGGSGGYGSNGGKGGGSGGNSQTTYPVPAGFRTRTPRITKKTL
uniref:Uncharacterized protein n=1 Tax=Cacopsylla melanoneura TaxID=428564 RepID=A0A8D8M7S0_9HEMI